MVSMRFGRGAWSLPLLSCLAVALSGCSMISSDSPQEVDVTFQPQKDLPKQEDQIAPDEENVIGRAVSAAILGKFLGLESPDLGTYINRVGNVVSGFSDRPATFAGYSFIVIESSEINAMAAPGGYIFISRGLLQKLSDEDMLAAVFAHEVSHVILRHGLKAIAREHMADYTPLAGGAVSAVDCTGLSEQLVTALGGAVRDIVTKLLESGYSKEEEFSADTAAVEILKRAGYDPKALDRVLQLLEKERSSSAGWFSTHPAPGERRAALRTVSGVGVEQEVEGLGLKRRKVRFQKALKTLQ